MRTESSSLGDLLFGQTRSRILALLFGHPDETFFVRQISRQIGTSVGTVQRELETLSGIGLVERSTSGKQVYYRANSAHPAYTELRSLIAKTSGIFQMLTSALAPLAQRIALAFVYGSMARQEETAASDVDLMVVGDVTFDEILEHLAPVERAGGRAINPTLYSESEFRSKLKDNNHFLRSVLNGVTVPLIGNLDEPRKMGRVRLA
jgi:predicted nucleotidyltransferase